VICLKVVWLNRPWLEQVTLDFLKFLNIPFNFYWPFKFLSNSLLTLTTYPFYWVAASVATSRTPIASIPSLIHIPHFLINKNLFFNFPDFLLVEFVALFGSQWQQE
jgi:hypothetical protein